LLTNDFRALVKNLKIEVIYKIYVDKDIFKIFNALNTSFQQ